MQLKKYTLGEIAEINASSIKLSDKIEEILYLDTTNITENKIDVLQKCDYKDAPSRAQRKVKNNTIIFSTVRPNQKHFGIMKNPPFNLIVSSGFVTLDIKDKEEFDADYLYYKLTQPFLVNYLQTVAQNQVSAYPSINPSDLSNLNLSFPPLPVQQKIAAVLSALDDKIALNSRINAKLEAMAKRLYDYWFVQFEFPFDFAQGKPDADGTFSNARPPIFQAGHTSTAAGQNRTYKTGGGKMVRNEQLKREIPEGWEVGVLSDIANITMGQSPEGSSYNENKKGVIFYQGSTDFGIRFPTERMYTTLPTRFAKKGDILMSVRAPVGTLNIANADCCIGRGLSSLNSKIGSIIHLWYVMDNFKHTFENKNVAGTTFGAITKDELFNLPVVIPAKDVINMFNTKTLPIFNQQLAIAQQSAKLTALRDRLIPLLMNGQVAVE